MQAVIDITNSSIQTKRLILRPFNKEDLNDVHYLSSFSSLYSGKICNVLNALNACSLVGGVALSNKSMIAL